MNICRNCKYFRPNLKFSNKDLKLSNGFCVNNISKQQNSVTGEVHYKYATEMRNEHYQQSCGVNGDLYEPETNVVIKTMREYSKSDYLFTIGMSGVIARIAYIILYS
jgi:hypothetical protein